MQCHFRKWDSIISIFFYKSNWLNFSYLLAKFLVLNFWIKLNPVFVIVDYEFGLNKYDKKKKRFKNICSI